MAPTSTKGGMHEGDCKPRGSIPETRNGAPSETPGRTVTESVHSCIATSMEDGSRDRKSGGGGDSEEAGLPTRGTPRTPTVAAV